jgi:hypothetical protein
MAREHIAELMLMGSSSLSHGAFACGTSQSLDHQRWLGRLEPANAGTPEAACR